MSGNRKISLVLACLSLAVSLLVSLYITSFQYSPVIVLFPFISLAGAIGILLRNKHLLIASTLVSLVITTLGIMTVGGLLAASSLPLIISTFVYPGDSRKAEVDEKVKKKIIITLAASVLIALFASLAETSWLYDKYISMGLLLSDFEFIFLFLLLITLPLMGIAGVMGGNKDFLNTAAAISIVPAIFMGLLTESFLFPVSCTLLVISAFLYESEIGKELKNKQ
ncbi:MAG: hypothetical protein FIB08_02015 [Candidatus Methanoperedens sp.]|nr:hypothetical protein [Candidatus Methanoperedens sp.]